MSDSGISADRVNLGTFPTPLEPAPRLAAALGLADDHLWIKRDDLVGLGGGGNKTRKLERAIARRCAAEPMRSAPSRTRAT
ncbi:MAG TPA: hypothetical protein VGG75_24800 [Trebonia sp.]|jgi:D-cysteine desulfhydrase